jgi:hypothetical protein
MMARLRYAARIWIRGIAASCYQREEHTKMSLLCFRAGKPIKPHRQLPDSGRVRVKYRR